MALLCGLLLCVVADASPQRPSADRVLAIAKAAAAAQHKHIFLVFGASWCPPCRELEAFLADRQMRPLIDKHFVVAELSVEEERGKHPELNSPGADKLLADLGGKDAGVPFIVFLDERGQSVVNSNRPAKAGAEGGNVGYPVLPEEIDWFMSMLRQTIPSQAAADALTIQDWLREAAGRQTQ
jgi:thiol-disulfide isomerase/thioredoxin